MRLSEIPQTDLSILHDAEFEDLGFVQQRQPRMLTFAETPRALASIRRNPDVTAVIASPEVASRVPENLGVAVSDQPRLAFAKLHNQLAASGFYWTDFETVVASDARIHPSAWIAPKNVRIGAGSVVLPHATILERCMLDEGVTVGAGAVLGGEGFQRVRGSHPLLEMEHAGGLVIGRGARILAGAVVATGLFRPNTALSRDVRIGAHAFVSHAATIGECTLIGHGAVINGNVRIGRDAWIGPGSVIANDLEIGDEAFVSLGSVVIRNVASGAHVSGNFAMPHRRMLRLLAGADEEPRRRPR
jgi:UDP-3-O-[3-hydroxymyristoyl] glucosamine N-acyltransferase